MKGRKKLEAKDKKKYLLIFGIIIVLFLIFLKTKQDTLNYPMNLYYLLIFCLSLIIIILKVKKYLSEIVLIKSYLDKFLFTGLNLFIVSTVSFFLAGIVLIPFNLFNIKFSKKNEIKIINCDLTGLTYKSGNSTIFYKYDNKTFVMHSSKKIMPEIYIDKDFDNYQIVFSVKKALLNTYIINDFNIIRK